MGDSTDIDFIIDDTNWWKSFVISNPGSGYELNFKNIYYVDNKNNLLRNFGTKESPLYYDSQYSDSRILKRQNYLKTIIRIKRVSNEKG